MAAVLRAGLITRFEIGQSADQFARVRICRYRDVVVLDDAVDVEKILEFAEDFQFVMLSKIEEARIAQINIVLRRSFTGIALDADRSV